MAPILLAAHCLLITETEVLLDCHQFHLTLFLLALWYRFGALAQVLSLMATLAGDRSHFMLSK